MSAAKLHHREEGSGRPIVLVHGFPLDGRIFDAQVQQLSKSYRVIVPDLPGFGQSPDSGAFSMVSLADDLHGFLKSIDALPCVLGGLSMGGYVALPFARKYPSDLRALMLIDTRAEADTPDGRTNRDRMIESARSRGVKAIADAMFPKLLAEANVRADPALGKRLRVIMESQRIETLCSALVAMREREDFVPVLPSIATPTLILVGEFDAITPLPCAEKMHAGLPRSWLVTIEGSGHMPVMERPARTSQVIERVLSELKLAPES